MNKSIKFLLLALVIAIAVPQVILAAWWNPFSWGFWNSMFHRQNQTQQQILVGGDKDAHGCIGSAGYSWCQVKNKCLRVWEEKCELKQTVGDITCIENDSYFVVAKEFEGVSDILSKHKTNSSQKIPCGYAKDKNDFELKGQEATYFMALTNNFLVLDAGTAPDPRVLIIYSLSTQKKVYEGKYAKPFTTIGDTITYWEPTNKIVTVENCPESTGYKANGLGAIIEAQVTLDLTNLQKTELGEYKCAPTQ